MHPSVPIEPLECILIHIVVQVHTYSKPPHFQQVHPYSLTSHHVSAQSVIELRPAWPGNTASLPLKVFQCPQVPYCSRADFLRIKLGADVRFRQPETPD